MDALKKLLFLILILLISVEGEEQNQKIRFESISFEEGISHNAAYSLMCDDKGFMWFGTMFGLIKYEGKSYKKFRHDPFDLNTLTNDDIVTMTQDSDGDIWLGTYGGGLNKLDYKSGKVTRYPPEFFNLENDWDRIIWSVAEDNDNNIWVGTNNAGILKFNRRSLDFVQFKYDSTNKRSIGSNSIRNIFVTGNGEILIGGGSKGLYIYSKENDDFEIVYDIAGNSEIKLNLVTSFENYGNNILIGTARGVYLFDPASKIISEQHEFDSLRDQWINEIHIDRGGNFWIGTGRGLFFKGKEEKSFTKYLTDLNNKNNNTISGNNVVAIAEDRAGIVWLGNYLGGIDKASLKPAKFQHYFHNPQNSSSLSSNRVMDFAVDKEGVIYAATGKGLNQFETSSGTFVNVSAKIFDEKNYPINYTHSVAADNNNNLWIGTYRGLVKLLPDRKTFKVFNTSSTPLPGNMITALNIDSENNLWIGTESGLSKLNLDNEKFEPVKSKQKDGEGIVGTTILSVYVDKFGLIWAGTYQGLNMIDPANDSYKIFRQNMTDSSGISNNYVFAYCETNDGEFWIGTGGGLNRFNRDTQTFDVFTEKDGLPNSVICGILEAPDGSLFISTNKGLCQFNRDENKFFTFSISDGLQSNMFLQRSYGTTNKGEMMFGGINGFNIFDPEKIELNDYSPPVYITSIDLFGKSLDEKTNGTEAAELDYDENFLTFHFTAIDYENPNSVQYSYKLDGIDEKWSKPSTVNFSEYKNLPPGVYSFLVKATNSDGVWAGSIAQYEVSLAPPFWSTWWFFAVTFFAFGFAAFAIHRYQVAAEIKKTEEIERIRVIENEKIRKKAAADFHDELGHRLTKISLFSEILKRNIEQISPEYLKYVNKISDISGSLSNGMRDFVWTLDPDKDTLYEVAVRLKDFGDELFHNSGIAFRAKGISEEFEKIKLTMDWRRHLTLIFKESMNNCLKYSKSENVTLSFEMKDGKLFMTLGDDGEGFILAKDTKGRGLKNIRRRAEDLHGNLEIFSQSGEGTVIHFNAALV